MSKKEIRTQVTSIAQEEARTGEEIHIPSPEKLVQLAHQSMVKCQTELAELFPKLSSRAKNRVFFSALAMATDDIPVLLQTNEEKQCFALSQRLKTDQFIILQHHTHQEYLKAQAKKQVDSSNVSDNIDQVTQ